MRIGQFAFRLAICLGMMSRADAWQVPTIAPQEKLNARVPAADPMKYRSVRDAEDWLNPYLLIQKDGVVMTSRTNHSDRTPISIDELRRTLVRLLVSAWPYGRVVGAKDNSFGGINLNGRDHDGGSTTVAGQFRRSVTPVAKVRSPRPRNLRVSPRIEFRKMSLANRK
jgi:hypothetical protein